MTVCKNQDIFRNLKTVIICYTKFNNSMIIGYRLYTMANILIIADSRGTGLQHEINIIVRQMESIWATVKIEVVVLGGANPDLKDLNGK